MRVAIAADHGGFSLREVLLAQLARLWANLTTRRSSKPCVGSGTARRVGVEPYEGSVRFIHQLRRIGFKIAVVTSSQNCPLVLKAAKLDSVFQVRVDGNTIENDSQENRRLIRS
jgi:beta-phosphoglucomutase-like phosphatase (HAD superfamily)